jgi:hypothetical protein
MRMISVDDARLQVSEAGQGSAVLLLHGIPTRNLATRLDDQWGSRPVRVAPRRRLGR